MSKALNYTPYSSVHPIPIDPIGISDEGVGSVADMYNRNPFESCIYGYVDDEPATDCWRIVCSANRNDAFHVSSPSRTAEGAYRALKHVLDRQVLSDLAFVNVHGTATLFNDEMEAVALSRAGLDGLPANGLKGYFGHTMGASGVLETLISMKALEDGLVLGTKGFGELGVS